MKSEVSTPSTLSKTVDTVDSGQKEVKDETLF